MLKTEQYYLNLFDILFKRGRIGELSSALTTAISELPDSAAIWQKYAEYLEIIGKPDAALSAISKGLELDDPTADRVEKWERLLGESVGADQEYQRISSFSKIYPSNHLLYTLSSALGEAHRELELQVQVPTIAGVASIQFSPDGTNVVILGGDGSLAIYQVSTGLVIRKINTDIGQVHAYGYSADGLFFLVQGRTREDVSVIESWRTVDGRLMWKIAGPSLGPISVSGRNFLGMTNAGLEVWDIQSGKRIETFKKNTQSVASGLPILRGERLFFVDGAVCEVLDAKSGTFISRITASYDNVRSYSISSDGRFFSFAGGLYDDSWSRRR